MFIDLSDYVDFSFKIVVNSKGGTNEKNIFFSNIADDSFSFSEESGFE